MVPVPEPEYYVQGHFSSVGIWFFQILFAITWAGVTEACSGVEYLAGHGNPASACKHKITRNYLNINPQATLII